MDDVCYCNDPPIFDWVSTIGPDLNYAKVEFVAPITPGITKDGPSASNECSLSAYCRFAQLLTYLPPIEGINLHFDLGIEFGNDPSDGVHSQIVCMQISLFGAS